jgi:hypothetical protein
MAAHSKYFSPSSWSRNLYCTAAAKLNAEAPQQSSAAADEGTQAHDYGERLLLANLIEDSDESIAQCDAIIDEMNERGHQEMISHVTRYVHHCLSERVPGCEVLVEQRVDFSRWIGDGKSAGDYKGTADCIIIADGICKVIDLKYGAGVKVFAEKNQQAMGYGLGSYSDNEWLCEFDKVELHIVQPRMDHIDVWKTDINELLAFGKFVKATSTNILNGDTAFKPSEKACQFCAIKPTCKALFEHNYGQATEGFDDIYDVETKDVATLSPAEISRLLPNLGLISSWVTSVREGALQAALSDTVIPGYKVVESRSRRQWADEEAALAALKKTPFKLDEVAPRTLLSPAQAEKLLGRRSKIVAPESELIVRPAGGPTLVPTSDKRPDIKEDALDGFEDIS